MFFKNIQPYKFFSHTISAKSFFIRMFRLTCNLLGKGGIFSARVHPRVKQILRGVKQESGLRREGITRFNKRWRSWAIRQVRLQAISKPVVLTVDPELMDPEYLATCMHSAASRNLKDPTLWKKYLNRMSESNFSPLHLGYVCWSIGKVQVSADYLWLMDALEENIPLMTSHGLASAMWMFRRALVLPRESLMEKITHKLLTEPDTIRSADFIKVCNNLAFFGFNKNNLKFRDSISNVAMTKFETNTFAQDFRETIEPLALVNLWNDEMKGYIMDRFRKIFITARPNHLLKAYYSAVTIRVLYPQVWYQHVSRQSRGFYTALAMRHIAAPGRGMDTFHKSVSAQLVHLGSAHRNMFRWGPFFIDIGVEDESDDKKTCIILDKASSFYTNAPKQYTEKSKLEHLVLSQVGWNVAHVNHRNWRQSKTRQIDILKSCIDKQVVKPLSL